MLTNWLAMPTITLRIGIAACPRNNSLDRPAPSTGRHGLRHSRRSNPIRLARRCGLFGIDGAAQPATRRSPSPRTPAAVCSTPGTARRASAWPSTTRVISSIHSRSGAMGSPPGGVRHGRNTDGAGGGGNRLSDRGLLGRRYGTRSAPHGYPTAGSFTLRGRGANSAPTRSTTSSGPTSSRHVTVDVLATTPTPTPTR